MYSSYIGLNNNIRSASISVFGFCVDLYSNLHIVAISDLKSPKCCLTLL